MTRMNTLSLPLAAALMASATLPALAQVDLTLGTNKTYRQKDNGKVVYRGGDYYIGLNDGSGTYVGGCARPFYWPANVPLDPCPGGSTGYLTFGTLDNEIESTTPYLWITSVVPAIIVEPRSPDLCILKAAPYSDLPRPSSDFIDDSYGVYYNLHTTEISEYLISSYGYGRNYPAGQRSRFEGDIVRGVYHYQFPRLDNPVLIAPVAAPIYEMPEGYTEKSNQWFGVRFTDTGNWVGKGYKEMSYITPNTIEWEGFTGANTYATVDSLYFSIRYLEDPTRPKGPITYVNPLGETPASLFPGFVSGGDPRILMENPFVTEFTLPPIFLGGTVGVVELELDRSFQTGGVTYDVSTRKFRMPVKVLNRYDTYAELRFPEDATKKLGLLFDYDQDGYNNMTEWILDSLADNPESIPIAPVTTLHPDVVDDFGFIIEPAWFGFQVVKKHGLRPRVKYTLQRSKTNGLTWHKMKSNNKWTVTNNGDEILVESNIFEDTDDDPLTPDLPVQPPNTIGDLYRVKITQRK